MDSVARGAGGRRMISIHPGNQSAGSGAMRIDKNLVVIGLSDDDTAHLRLLMRKAGEQLQQRWRWGSEEGADLVVVDTNAFAGQMARTRALAAGMRVAVITD